MLTVPAGGILPEPALEFPAGPTTELEHPQALMTQQGYLVLQAATGSQYNNLITISNNHDGDLVVTDELVPFVTADNIPGATLSSNGHVLTIPRYAVWGQQIYLYGGDGDDTLTVNMNQGNPILAGGLTFEGGSQNGNNPGDGIVISGGTAENIDYASINEHDGSISIDGLVVNYTGLEPITDNANATNRSFTMTGGTEAVVISDVGGADGFTQINSSLGELVNFTAPTASLTVITNGGDTVNITGFDPAFNTPLLSLQGTTSANTYNLGAANIIPDATSLSLMGNADFNLNGFSETIGSLASTDATPTITLSARSSVPAPLPDRMPVWERCSATTCKRRR